MENQKVLATEVSIFATATMLQRVLLPKENYPMMTIRVKR